MEPLSFTQLMRLDVVVIITSGYNYFVCNNCDKQHIYFIWHITKVRIYILLCITLMYVTFVTHVHKLC